MFGYCVVLCKSPRSSSELGTMLSRRKFVRKGLCHWNNDIRPFRSGDIMPIDGFWHYLVCRQFADWRIYYLSIQRVSFHRLIVWGLSLSKWRRIMGSDEQWFDGYQCLFLCIHRFKTFYPLGCLCVHDDKRRGELDNCRQRTSGV